MAIACRFTVVKMRILFKIISWLFITSGIVIIIMLRIIGIDLTEGQIFIQYTPYWILAAGLLIGSVAISSNIKNE